MTTEERVRKLWRGMPLVFLAASLLILAACMASTGPSPDDKPADDKRIVPGVRAGTYVLLKSTGKEILGEDRQEGRNRLAKQGLFFQFEQGRELTGVTVNSPAFRTSGGLRVGSTAEEVRKEFGEPRTEEVGDTQGKGLRFPVLAYPSDGIMFLMEDGEVRAVVILPRQSDN